MSRDKLLKSVASEIVACTKCPLCIGRKKAVPGEGNSKASIMFVGEAPGRSEDEQGRPFVGSAGKLLNTLLSTVDLRRESAFICNVVRCRPPRNREPRSMEVETCAPYMDSQIKIIRPRVIVSLGNCATANVFFRAGLPFEGVSQIHGVPVNAKVSGLCVTVFPTFHPAAALYNPSYGESLQRDFESLKTIVERNMDHVSKR